MKLHNTLTRKVDEFKPIDGDLVRMYSCGPTVYASAHIGNISSYIYADILRRVVVVNGFRVKHVMNFTDIDDKTIHNSRIEYPDLEAKFALQNLTKKYEDVFLRDMVSVGNDVNNISFTKATDHIQEIQDLVRRLVDIGVAYIAEDGVYFSIKKYTANHVYGQLSKIDLSGNFSKERICNDEYDKDSINDFALWKKQKAGEPAWEFTVDGQDLTGRPGWHIECSAMSTSLLGQPFDIHTGGVDLIFPHHENEIAQSTAGDQTDQYAAFFVHNEHLLVDGKKMSKSENNFYKLSDLVDQGFSPLDFRMMVLQSHYRSPTNFSWSNLQSAQNRFRHWRNIAELRHQFTDSGNPTDTSNLDSMVSESIKALGNDLDTPTALKYFDKAFDYVFNSHSSLMISQLVGVVDDCLGLKLSEVTPDINEAVYKIISDRQEARQQHNWPESDRLRDQLTDLGIYIKDGDMPRWYRH